jgi:hypothetical protein
MLKPFKSDILIKINYLLERRGIVSKNKIGDL